MPDGLRSFEDFELDAAAYRLKRRGRPVKLERLPFDLLQLLIDRHPSIVGREEIVDALWGRNTLIDTEYSINSAIRKIRIALQDKIEQPRFVLTVPGRGYRFIGKLNISIVDTSGVSQPQSSVESQLSNPLSPASNSALSLEPARDFHQNAAQYLCGNRVNAILMTVVGAALAGLIVILALELHPVQQQKQPLTLAVMPFQNLSGNSAQVYFSDGLTEETINSIGRLGPDRLRVIARTSSIAYRSTHKTVVEIGHELGADYLLEGSVRRDGVWVRVSTKLIRVRDQVQVWGENYDRTGVGVIGLQDEISDAIARKVKITAERRPQKGYRRQTSDEQAFDLYLRGRSHWSRSIPSEVAKAIECFKQSIAKDPDYALAYSGLADAYTTMTLNSDVAPSDVNNLARQAAYRAVNLDQKSAEAQTSIGAVAFFLEWKWKYAAKALKEATTLAPQYAMAHRYYAHLLANSSRYKESKQEVEQLLKLDPLSPAAHALAGQFSYLAGDYPTALDHLRTASALDDDLWIVNLMSGKAFEQAGQNDRALEHLSKALSFSNNTEALSLRGYILAKIGKRAAAAEIADYLSELSQTRFVPPYNIALVYAGLRDSAMVQKWLYRAYEVRDVHLIFLPVDPKWNDFKNTAPFRDIVRRCGFE